MASIADLVEAPTPQRLASSADFQVGVAMAALDGVSLDRFGPTYVAATVRSDDGSRTTVQLRRNDDDTLEWTCECPSGAAGAFCEHAVAAAVVTWERAPLRRR